MPTYTVVLRVIVPELGTRDVTYLGVIATSLDDAVKQKIGDLKVEPIKAEKTGA